MWNTLVGVSNLVGTLIVALAALLALRQLRESSTARLLSSTIEMMARFERPNFLELRSFLEGNREQLSQLLESEQGLHILDQRLRSHEMTSGSIESVAEIRSRLAELEHFAVLSLHGMLLANVERTYYAPIVKDIWPDIFPFAQAIRRHDVRRHSGPTQDFLRANPVYLQHLDRVHNLISSGEFYASASTVRKAKRSALRKAEENSRDYVALQSSLDPRLTPVESGTS